MTHQLHKSRRASVASYFSRGMILRLEKDVIQKAVEKLCKRIEGFKTSKQPLPLGTAYRAFTTDVITDYTMGQSFNFLDRADFYEQWFEEFLQNVRLVHTITHYPWLPVFAKKLPSPLRDFILPRTSQLLKFHNVSAHISPLLLKLLAVSLTAAITAGCRGNSRKSQRQRYFQRRPEIYPDCLQ